MAEHIDRIIARARADKGPFFVARLTMRVGFKISEPNLPDDAAHIRELVEACRSMGYDVPADVGSGPARG